MPYIIDWLQPKCVVFVQYIGILSLDELRVQQHINEQMIIDGEPPVHVMVDMTQLKHIEFSLRQLRSLIPNQHPHAGWVMFYGQQPLATFLGSVTLQVINARFRFCSTRAEALDFLQTRDLRIDPALFKVPTI